MSKKRKYSDVDAAPVTAVPVAGKPAISPCRCCGCTPDKPCPAGCRRFNEILCTFCYDTARDLYGLRIMRRTWQRSFSEWKRGAREPKIRALFREANRRSFV